MIQDLFGFYPDLATFILRLAVGSLFMIHGYPKLKAGRKGDWMKNFGMPVALVPFAGIVEFFGGLALLLGILTPLIAFLSALWMLSTTWFKVNKIKAKYAGGYEIDITLLLAALAITFLGSGIYSIDHLLGI
ncbi:MAG TPA: DoxX family protein [Candidatus Bathyarchaeia archaeon]|nr:DoxX family protein [Candidatus Bathyarchaeia archaeon]